MAGLGHEPAVTVFILFDDDNFPFPFPFPSYWCSCFISLALFSLFLFNLMNLADLHTLIHALWTYNNNEAASL